jgi:hypothetical protein
MYEDHLLTWAGLNICVNKTSFMLVIKIMNLYDKNILNTGQVNECD